MESLPWLYAGDLNNGGRGDNMNALQFVSTPVQNFRLTRRQPRAKKDEESTSLFSTYSSTKTRKWVREEGVAVTVVVASNLYTYDPHSCSHNIVTSLLGPRCKCFSLALMRRLLLRFFSRSLRNMLISVIVHKS